MLPSPLPEWMFRNSEVMFELLWDLERDTKGGGIRKADEQRGGTFDTCGTIINTHKTCHKASTKKITWET